MATAIIEHESHAYEHAKVWHYTESKSDFVASASWAAWQSKPGGCDHKLTTRVLSAESDDINALRIWCDEQREKGAEHWRIHATWPIPEKHAPRGHMLHGKRENGFREGWSKPRDVPPSMGI